MSRQLIGKTMLDALETGVKACSQRGQQIAKGVELARPGMNHTIATVQTSKGTKVVETVKNIVEPKCDSGKILVAGKWQEITDERGVITTIWRKPKCNNVDGCQYGWRRETPEGVIESFREGGDAIIMNKSDYGRMARSRYPRELSYMYRDKEGHSLIAIKEAHNDTLTIRAKDIQLANGLNLNGVYTCYNPDMSLPVNVLHCAKAPAGTDKGILFEVFTSVNKFLNSLRKPAV